MIIFNVLRKNSLRNSYNKDYSIPEYLTSSLSRKSFEKTKLLYR